MNGTRVIAAIGNTVFIKDYPDKDATTAVCQFGADMAYTIDMMGLISVRTIDLAEHSSDLETITAVYEWQADCDIQETSVAQHVNAIA